MRTDVGEGRLVSGVETGGRPMTLVEDTTATDGEGSPAESHRTWCSDAGAEITTITCAARADADVDLAQRVSDALVGAILGRSFAMTDREDVAATLRDARESPLRRDEESSLVVDGRPARAVVASSDGATVRGTVAGTTVVLVVGTHDPLSLTLTSS